MSQFIKSPLDGESAKITAKALQDTLVDLVDLSLQTKQAHWNLIGPNFRSLHLQLDEMVVTYRDFSDTVAERKVTIGQPAQGQAGDVTSRGGLEPLPADWMQDTDVIELFVARLHGVSARMRERIKAVGEVDPVTEDLFIQVTNTLEQQAWMIQAQRGA